MNLDNLRLNSTHNPENNLIIYKKIDEISDAFFTWWKRAKAKFEF